MTLGANGEEDEYDMVDDADDPAPNGTQSRNKSKLKYMDILQDVSNRMRDNILIDLNDVEAVSIDLQGPQIALKPSSSSVLLQTTSTITS